MVLVRNQALEGRGAGDQRATTKPPQSCSFWCKLLERIPPRNFVVLPGVIIGLIDRGRPDSYREVGFNNWGRLQIWYPSTLHM